MHCRLLTQYAIIMVEFLAGLRKIKLRPGYGKWRKSGKNVFHFSINLKRTIKAFSSEWGRGGELESLTVA